MYSVVPDRRLGRINIRVRGFWTDATLDRFATAHLAAVRALGLPDGHHTILGDMTGLDVQSIDVIARAQHFFANADNKARRIALVASGAVSTLQAKRMSSVRHDMRIFASIPEAEAWLDAG